MRAQRAGCSVRCSFGRAGGAGAIGLFVSGDLWGSRKRRSRLREKTCEFSLPYSNLHESNARPAAKFRLFGKGVSDSCGKVGTNRIGALPHQSGMGGLQLLRAGLRTAISILRPLRASPVAVMARKGPCAIIRCGALFHSDLAVNSGEATGIVSSRLRPVKAGWHCPRRPWCRCRHGAQPQSAWLRMGL